MPVRPGSRLASPALRASTALLVSTALLAPAALLPTGCALNPVTGRPQVVLSTNESEIELGKEMREAAKSEWGLVDDAELTQYVEQIGTRLAALSPRQEVPYSFDVLNVEDPNALAGPGGPIYVTRGLLALTNSEDELVNVVAHEVGHVAALHYKSGQTRRAGAGLLGVIGAIGGVMLGGPQLGQVVGGLTQIGLAGLVAAHSREQERQADEVGQSLASEAGWDPAGMSSFMHSLGRYTELQLGAPRESSFFDTHPSTPEREADTAERARALTRAAPQPIARTRAEYLERLRGLVLGQDPEQGIFLEHEERNIFVQADMDLRIRFPDMWVRINTPSWVGGAETDGSVLFKLTIDSEGDDPEAAANKFLDEELDQIIPRKRRKVRLKELIGYEVEFMTPDRQGIINMIWVAKDDTIFRLQCAIAAPLHQNYVRDCYLTARSLRSINAKEREQIRRVELQLATARAGETLAAFAERTGNEWSDEETAVFNSLELDATLREGQLVKVALSEPYVPKPKPPPSETDGTNGTDGTDGTEGAEGGSGQTE